MNKKDVVIKDRYVSNANPIQGLEYEVLEKFDRVCKVRLWEEGVPSEVVYDDVRYTHLSPKPADINELIKLAEELLGEKPRHPNVLGSRFKFKKDYDKAYKLWMKRYKRIQTFKIPQ